jgi:ribosomal-protein-alanine N-acetyltransferase
MYIRTLQAGDADALLAFELANRSWFERSVEARAPEFYTVPGVRLHIAAYLDDYRHGRMHPCVMLGEDGAIIGRANLRYIDTAAGNAEVGYRVAHARVGQGLASAALRHLQRLAVDEWKLSRLQAWVASGNPASARVLEKHGFRKVPGMPPQSAAIGEALRESFLYECELSAL